MKTDDRTEAVVYLRELLEMNRQQLILEVRNHPDLQSRTRKNEIIAYAFELKFDSTVKPPTSNTGLIL